MADNDMMSWITEAKKEFNARWDVMDKVRDLVYMEDYQLKGTSGKFKNKAIDGAVNVTMNTAAIHANTIASTLMEGKWQTVIEGKLPSSKSHKVEEFIDNVWTEIDERLITSGNPILHAWNCNHITVRGLIGGRFLWRKYTEGPLSGTAYPDYLTIDMRWCVYENDYLGIKKAGYFNKRRASDIMDEYNVTLKDGLHDVWVAYDRESEYVYVNNNLVAQKKHGFGYIPMIISTVPAGFMLRDDGWREYDSPDALFMNLKLYNEQNRSVSITQTGAMTLIRPSYQKEVAEKGGEPPPYPNPIGDVIEVLKGEPYTPLQVKDTNAAHQIGMNLIDKAVEEGGLPGLGLGTWTSNNPPSGAAITAMSEIRAKVLNPRLEALASFRSSLARMILNQWSTGGYGGELGQAGLKTSYSAGDLGDPNDYNISYRLMSRSKVQEIANISIAAAARPYYSLDSILRNIVMTDDPEGEIAKLEAERAEQAYPAMFFLRKALALARSAKESSDTEREQKYLEAYMLTKKCVQMLESEGLQALPEGELKEPKPTGNIMPLTSGLGVS
ncbi:MAG: hypothetical protein WC455_20840 [Dehalococcoidia bacterium]|jgi:hypothetical protein